MIYKDFKDLKLSNLGVGMMRLPLKEDKTTIDEEHAARMIEYAINNGINYFDTAWGYHGGESEMVAGRLLSKYPRESYYLASKFPGYDLANMGKVEEIFERQLEKCQTEYFDFYLIHNVCEKNINEYLDPKYGTLDYLLKQKENGRIKHFGFSVHGTLDVTKRFLEVYGKYMEFGQIQLNYLDYEFQDAKAKMELFKELGIPVWVMEPIRGGKLANVGEENEARIKEIRNDETPVSFAFRFLQSFPEVTVILSGMSSMDQLTDNIKTFEEAKPLNEDEMRKTLDLAKDMLSKNVLPCTECRYCTEYCPQKLEIPELISLYNEFNVIGGGFIAPMRIETMADDKKPSACIGCKSCEAVCPQNIKISEAMADFTNKLNGLGDK